MAVLDLCCCVGSSLIAVCRLLIAAASLFAEHRLQGTWASVVVAHVLSSSSSQALQHRLNSCSTWAWFSHGMWNLLRSGIKPMSPALAGGFFTTEPPGKPCMCVLSCPVMSDSL